MMLTTEDRINQLPACKECGAVQFTKYGHFAECSQFLADAEPPPEQAEWCDDCHGYTHAPWCPAYIPERSVTEIRAAYDSWRAFRCASDNMQVFEYQNEQMHRDIGVLLRVLETLEQPTLTEPESQLVIGAMPLQGLPNAATPEPPAPDAGEWRYRETAYSAEVIAGELTLKPHWTGPLKPEVIQVTMRQVIDDHRLAGLVPGLVETLQVIQAMTECSDEQVAKLASAALNTLSKEQGG